MALGHYQHLGPLLIWVIYSLSWDSAGCQSDQMLVPLLTKWHVDKMAGHKLLITGRKVDYFHHF
jgi:hypothetical protein